MELTATKYKQTEVGLIPEEWELKKLTYLVDYIHGKAHENVISKYGKYIVVNSKYISTEGETVKHSKENYCPAKKGDVLTVLSDIPNGKALVKCYLVNEDDKYSVNQRICIWRPKNIDSKFLFYKLNRYPYFLALNDGVNQTNIGNSDIDKCVVDTPPTLTEQKAIAQVLSDTDSLIQALEKKIAKKKHIKKGVMQKLLTPKEDWEVKAIKNIVSTPVTDGPHETPEFISSGVPFLSVNNIVNNKIDKSALRYISKSDDTLYSKKCKPQKHDILLGKAASVGKVAIVEDNWNFNVWSPLALIRLKSDISPYFIYYMFQTYELLSQIDGLTNSSSQGNIGMVDIEKLTIPIPKESELQESIANVFINIDKEIAQLEQKRSKYQLAKQGMMQQLLTGKIRLV
jgi:type I restriction enzyme, S subunit